MSSIEGLPSPGSDVTILITKVHLHPLCALVEFWGKFRQDRTADYECLAKNLQYPGNTFQEFEGSPGDQCLIQIDGVWCRCRIVSRNGSKYSVFLIDKGMSYSTAKEKLAWGKKSHFLLPPEVEFCVLANVLPLSPENRWSPVGLEFLKSLSGKCVKAHVQDVLVLHRTFLLHIPSISKQMYEMGIAKKLSPDVFQDFVLKSLQSGSETEASPRTQQIPVIEGERLHKRELFMYPELPAGTVETVVVTDVTNPQRIFCQLKVFSQELKKLSEQITQCCEGRRTNCVVDPEMVGYPCAARGSDGRWYRSVLQQVFPTNKMVEVLNVDFGTKQFVLVENVRPLAAEFFRMPVVTYVCSLHGIIDKGVGWTSSQIEYLKTLLLYKTVIAKFEYQSVSEGVHYVTFYGDENANINKLFADNESYSLECEKTLRDYAIRSVPYSRQHPAQLEKHDRGALPPQQAAEEKNRKGRAEKLPTEELSVRSSHVAVVQHVSDPSEFWIQTQKYTKQLDELMDGINRLYKDSPNKDVVRNPTFGLYCAAKAKDGDFYRATVSEVGDAQIKVFFVDYGNTDVVARNNVRALPDEFRKLPCLALKCSLAGVWPKDGRWSSAAREFFVATVADKTQNVHVASKHDEGYVVQLTDPEAQGEKDLSTLMCIAGLVERAETPRQHKAKMAAPPPVQHPDPRLSGGYRNNGASFPRSAVNERIPAFKENMFPIGSVLDVSVSHIESPNDFWCQLQNTGHLKLLMHDIQAYYAGSEFQPFVETACIARHPDNGMWYRALVIHKHETPHVDLLFVDYGQTETVSLYDLRRICPEFLSLRGQAFRCSLLNPVDPTSATNEWSEEAVAKFHSFVETAAANFMILKCTIYAVMFNDQKILFNIVDLETPFESVSTSMMNLVKSAPPKKGTPFRLDTYYYSTHGVKTGTEEQVTVTCVNGVGHFYCQLDRNAGVMNDLALKVNSLCRQLENVKLPAVFGTLCFAKYTDGQWYRGQIKATKPATLVHFVDYGDTIEVKKSDLLPIPREANDIMSVPVQAVVCGLSDVPADVPREVNGWFETNATESKFKALVVAREPDGKLQVELYQGNNQINSKIKRKFHIEMNAGGEQVVMGSRRAHEASANRAQRAPKPVPRQARESDDHPQTFRKKSSATNAAHQARDADVGLHAEPKPLHRVGENGQRVKAAPIELYRPPQQRGSSGKTPRSQGNGPESEAAVKPRRESVPADGERLVERRSPDAESQKQSDTEKLPKLADLPSTSITAGMEADVFISHCNSPLSFYVQLTKDENDIFSLVEKLNDPRSSPETDPIKDPNPGDLVQAEFADDSSWYRAAVRETHDATALVEFIDFGNTAMIPKSKITRLHRSFLQLPSYSTHCTLSAAAAALAEEDVLHPEVISAFREDVGSSGEKVLKCRFIKQTASVWEVSVEDCGVNVVCKAPAGRSTSEIGSEKLEQVEEKPDQEKPESSPESPQSSLRYHQQEFPEGSKLQVYITTTNDALTFWCQPVVSEELDKITARVSEVGDAAAADHGRVDPVSLAPGRPCVALFSGDRFWYRAEVIDVGRDELSVLFVDYGNRSRVGVEDVRELPADLMQTPPLAFLCRLEGFDSSLGSWAGGAADEFSALTADKELTLTVTGVTREEGNVTHLVKAECEGQVINEALKTWFSQTENTPAEVETVTSGDQQGEHSAVCPQKDLHAEQNTDELIDPQPAGEHHDGTEGFLHREALEETTEEEGDPILSAETLREVSNPEENMVPRVVVSQTPDMSSCDSSLDETSSPPPDSTDDRELLTSSGDMNVVGSDEGTEEENMSVMETVGPDVVKSLPEEKPAEIIDESETHLVSPPGQEITHSEEVSDPSEQSGSEVKMAGNVSLHRMTAVKMVPREHHRPREDEETAETTSKDSEQVQTEVLLPSSVLPAFKQEAEADDGVSEDEEPSVPPHVQSDVTAEDADVAANQIQTCAAPHRDLDVGGEEATPSAADVCSATDEPDDDGEVTGVTGDSLSGGAAEEKAQSEPLLPHEHTAPQSDPEPDADTVLSRLVDEVTCLVGEIHLTDTCTVPQEFAESEVGERRVETHTQQDEDLSLLEEEVTSADDSFEAELLKITHLSLIIDDSPVGVRPAEQQPEE